MFQQSITFKQAFIIVICLHVAGYFGIAKLSEFRKQIRQSKPNQTIAKSQPRQWPSATKAVDYFIMNTKTTAQPVVKNAEQILLTVTNKITNKTEPAIELIIPPKKELAIMSQKFTKTVQQITKPTLVSKKQLQTKTTPLAQKVPATFIKMASLPKYQKPQIKTTTKTTNTKQIVPQISYPMSKEIYTVDGVDYIEIREIVSTHVTL
jgi:hypothetical protein